MIAGKRRPSRLVRRAELLAGAWLVLTLAYFAGHLVPLVRADVLALLERGAR